MTGADLQYDQHSSEEELEVGIFEIWWEVRSSCIASAALTCGIGVVGGIFRLLSREGLEFLWVVNY